MASTVDELSDVDRGWTGPAAIVPAPRLARGTTPPPIIIEPTKRPHGDPTSIVIPLEYLERLSSEKRSRRLRRIAIAAAAVAAIATALLLVARPRHAPAPPPPPAAVITPAPIPPAPVAAKHVAPKKRVAKPAPKKPTAGTRHRR